MKFNLLDVQSGVVKETTAAKNDFVLLLKARSHMLFPQHAGKSLKLFTKGSSHELEDSKFLGEYPSLKQENLLEIVLPKTQPFSATDYQAELTKQEAKLGKRPLESFFDPRGEDNDWDEEWRKGKEYLNYPPVPTQTESGDATEALVKQKNSLFEAIGARKMSSTDFEFSSADPLSRGRRFHSLYICRVRDYSFSLLHKFEGKWSGSALHFAPGVRLDDPSTASDGENPDPSPQNAPPTQHTCSGELTFDPNRRLWVENQVFTSPSGLSSRRVFTYTPIADGLCAVECDDPRLLGSTTLRLREQDEGKGQGDVLVFTGVSLKTGNTILTETIVLTSHVRAERRTRTISRFGASGALQGVVVCSEKKVIDSESGALAHAVF